MYPVAKAARCQSCLVHAAVAVQWTSVNAMDHGLGRKGADTARTTPTMPEIGDTQDHGSVFAGRVSHTSVASALQSNAKAAYVKYSQQRTMRRLQHHAQMERDAAVTRITLDSRADAAALQLASKLAMRTTVAQWRDGRDAPNHRACTRLMSRCPSGIKVPVAVGSAS